MSSEVHPQTKSEIRALLRGADVRPNRRRGQSFLIDGNLMRCVFEAADVTASDLVFEVGTGTGSLTRMLAAAAGEVVTVEVDATLADIARGELSACSNVTLIRADVLAGKHRLNPEVLDALEAAAARHEQTKLVANLPYSAATPLLLNLVFASIVFERMVFTVQAEVSERLVATPGTRAYGWVSVVVALAGEAEVLRPLPATAFWPQPEVASALVRFRPRADWRSGIDVERLCAFGTFVFQQRRKTTLRILRDTVKRADCEIDPAALLDKLGIDAKTRGDQLTPSEILGLSQTLPTQ